MKRRLHVTVPSFRSTSDHPGVTFPGGEERRLVWQSTPASRREGTLSAEQRADPAKEITRSHVAISGEPASFVRVIFETVSPDSTFSGGKPAVNASIVGIIRGRSTEVKAQLLNNLWSLYKNVTGLSDDQLWVSVTEIPPSNAMEFGAIIPEVGHEAEWQASLGRTKQ